MTELDLVKHAKDYIDQLANGIDPISGQAAPEDSVLNQARLARCFFYVSGILGQVIENGGRVGAKKRTAKQPFFLPLERREAVPFSPQPLPISKFLERLNGMTDPESIKRLPPAAVTGWLLEKGFLTERTDASGRHTKAPTEQGEAIGLSTERRQGQNGEYTVTLYNESAQRFLVDNLDEILQRYQEQHPARAPGRTVTGP